MIIVWDEAKRIANLVKHRIDFAEIGETFFASSIVIPARAGRYQAFGTRAGEVLAVVFAPLGAEAISLISARRASQKERKLLDG